jgi:hypothetical protein
MSNLVTGNFETLTATGTSDPVNISAIKDVYCQIAGTTSPDGTWVIEVSFDGGTSWVQFATGDEAAFGLKGPLPPCTHARIGWTRTAGTLVGGYGGTFRG